MSTYSEILPPSKSSPHAGLDWTPGDHPGCGELHIKTARCHCRYRVTETATDPRYADGRAWRLEKLSAGSDCEASDYFVFVSRRHPSADSCECRGFLRWGSCKHIASIRALLENGWLDMSPVNPDADVGRGVEPDDVPF
jgi:hypothetical protein